MTVPCDVRGRLLYAQYIYISMYIYYIPEKRKFSGILCFRQQRSRAAVRRRVTISLLAR